MGLDATLARVKFNVKSDLRYEEIRNQKYAELKYDNEIFEAWEHTVWEEILYTSDWEIAHMIDSRNIGSKAVNFSDNRDLILSKKDVKIIIVLMETSREKETNLVLKEILDKHISQLRNCLETTDFKKETLLFGEWS